MNFLSNFTLDIPLEISLWEENLVNYRKLNFLHEMVFIRRTQPNPKTKACAIMSLPQLNYELATRFAEEEEENEYEVFQTIVSEYAPIGVIRSANLSRKAYRDIRSLVVRGRAYCVDYFDVVAPTERLRFYLHLTHFFPSTEFYFDRDSVELKRATYPYVFQVSASASPPYASQLKGYWDVGFVMEASPTTPFGPSAADKLPYDSRKLYQARTFMIGVDIHRFKSAEPSETDVL